MQVHFLPGHPESALKIRIIKRVPAITVVLSQEAFPDGQFAAAVAIKRVKISTLLSKTAATATMPVLKVKNVIEDAASLIVETVRCFATIAAQTL